MNTITEEQIKEVTRQKQIIDYINLIRFQTKSIIKINKIQVFHLN